MGGLAPLVIFKNTQCAATQSSRIGFVMISKPKVAGSIPDGVIGIFH
jgi:hypothetical protein